MKAPVKIIMLPTKDITKFALVNIPFIGDKLYFLNIDIEGELRGKGEYQHFYATVSPEIEPIKKGDWCMYNGLIVQATSEDKVYKEYRASTLNEYSDGKIIATTDFKILFKIYNTGRCTCQFNSGICEIHKRIKLQQSFLKEFVKNPDGEWEVEYEVSKTNEICICGESHPIKLEGYCQSCGSYDRKYFNYYKLKLNQDNTINITPAKICEHPFKRLHWIGNNVFCNACKKTLIKNS